MWIERLDIRGFRSLTGVFELSPDLNLVVGDNEAGKSTLHDAAEQASMAEKIETIRQRLLLTERDQLSESVVEAGRLRQRASRRVDVPDSPPQHLVDAVRASSARLEQLAESRPRLEAGAAEAQQTVGHLEGRERELDAELHGLESYADVDSSAESTVQRVSAELGALRTAASPLPGRVPDPDPRLARYRAERLELLALAAGKPPWTAKRVAWIALVVLTLGLAWLVRAGFRRLRGSEPEATELDRRLAGYGVSSLDELDEQAAEEAGRRTAASAAAELAAQQTAERESQLRALGQELDSAPDGVRAPGSGSVETRAGAYLAGCEIFLVQRLEIARLLAPAKGQAPLILDDPFARYDPKRLRLGLELLGEAASERQVLILSEDASLPMLAQEICGACHVVELPAPRSPA